MSTLRPQTRCYHGENWSCELMSKPWWIDLLTIGVVALWMSLTFATMQMHEPSLALIGSALIIGVVGFLLIYGQRLTYLQVGKVVIETDEHADGRDEREHDR